MLQRIIPPNEQKERLIKGRVTVQVEMLTTKNKDLRRSKLQVMKLSRLTEKEIETEGDKETEWERERERQRERERERERDTVREIEKHEESKTFVFCSLLCCDIPSVDETTAK